MKCNENGIYYKGLIGSRLFNTQTEHSDFDYWIITPQSNIDNCALLLHEQNRLTLSDHYEDWFYYTPEDMIELLFTRASSQYCYATHAYCIPGLWSTPDPNVHTEFAQWLIDNRQILFDANRPLWHEALMWRSKQVQENPYEHSPKELLLAIFHLEWHNRYARLANNNFLQAMQLTKNDIDMVHKVQALQLSNIDLLQKLNQLVEDSVCYKEFWHKPIDEMLLKQLQIEARLALNLQ